MKLTLEDIENYTAKLSMEPIHHAIVFEARDAKNWDHSWTLFTKYLCPAILASQEVASDSAHPDHFSDKQVLLAKWSISALVRYAPSPAESNLVYMFFLQQCLPPIRDDETIDSCLVSLIYQYAQVKDDMEVHAKGLDLIKVAIDRGIGLPTYQAHKNRASQGRPQHQKESILASVSKSILNYHHLQISADGTKLESRPARSKAPHQGRAAASAASASSTPAPRSAVRAQGQAQAQAQAPASKGARNSNGRLPQQKQQQGHKQQEENKSEARSSESEGKPASQNKDKKKQKEQAQPKQDQPQTSSTDSTTTTEATASTPSATASAGAGSKESKTTKQPRKATPKASGTPPTSSSPTPTPALSKGKNAGYHSTAELEASYPEYPTSTKGRASFAGAKGSKTNGNGNAGGRSSAREIKFVPASTNASMMASTEFGREQEAAAAAAASVTGENGSAAAAAKKDSRRRQPRNSTRAAEGKTKTENAVTDGQAVENKTSDSGLAQGMAKLQIESDSVKA